MKCIETEDDLAHGIEALIALDGRFAPVYQATGLPPLRRSPAGFSQLLYIITEQMISLKAAAAIWQRTCDAIDPISPEAVLAADDAAYRLAGQSRAKQRTMQAVAGAIVDGRLDLAGLASLSDDEARSALLSIKGIGPWTAEVYLLSCLGRPDAWPGGDVALQSAAQSAFALAARPGPCSMRALAEPWRPWRAVAARLLWAHYRLL